MSRLAISFKTHHHIVWQSVREFQAGVPLNGPFIPFRYAVWEKSCPCTELNEVGWFSNGGSLPNLHKVEVHTPVTERTWSVRANSDATLGLSGGAPYLAGSIGR